MSTPDGLVADRYELVRLLGSGGMGVVWEAWDQRLERRVALKRLHPQPGLTDAEVELANQRAMREARINARLHHPYAVPVFDVVEQDGQPCLIMQFVPSVPLTAVLREGGPLQPEEAAQVGAQVGSALAAAHQAGIVHRDVKPGNILVTDDGTALISDFGISHALGDATLTETGMVHGTPAYLAPEVARGGEARYASDVFSFGSTLYAALEGTPPFGTDQNSIALLHRVAAGTYDPPRRSGPLTPLLVEMLAPDPADRPTMTAVAQRLRGQRFGPAPAATAPAPALPQPVQAGLSAQPVEATPPAPVLAGAAPPADPPPVRRSRPGRVAIAVVAVLVAALVVTAVVLDRLPGGAGVALAPPGRASVIPTPAPTPATPSRSPSESTPTPPSTPTPRPTPSATPTPSPTRPTTPATPTRPTTPASQPSPANPPSPTRVPTLAPGPPTGAELSRAISDYYALMPRGTDAAWPRMTASYQTNTAGGRRSYEQFWGPIARVSASDVTGAAPDGAQATITYYYADGRVARERTSYRLVREGGVLKIDGSTVG